MKPATWKRQTPDKLVIDRIRARLTPAELEVVDRDLKPVKASLRHNVYDGIGIGLHVVNSGHRSILL